MLVLLVAVLNIGQVHVVFAYGVALLPVHGGGPVVTAAAAPDTQNDPVSGAGQRERHRLLLRDGGQLPGLPPHLPQR